MPRRDQRPHLGLLVGRIPHSHPARRLDEQFEEAAVGAPLDEDPGARAAWPRVVEDPDGAAAAARSRSASAKTTFADLPPSSSVTRLIVAVAPAITVRPTSVDPVKPTFATFGCSTRRCPTTVPGPTRTLTTPSGIPASSASSASRSAESGVNSAGGHDGVPAAPSAGPSFYDAMLSGKFHGTIDATTPSGSRNVMSTPPATGIVSP